MAAIPALTKVGADTVEKPEAVGACQRRRFEAPWAYWNPLTSLFIG
jgi:hypothetical protein